INYRIFYC
ncbi:DDE_Tnp_1-associated family protein, partial [Escherichia coli 99.0672]